LKGERRNNNQLKEEKAHITVITIEHSKQAHFLMPSSSHFSWYTTKGWQRSSTTKKKKKKQAGKHQLLVWNPVVRKQKAKE
jgi:hypothetical protein